MTIIEVEINSKIYQIGCENEDKDRILECTEILNERIEKFKDQDPVFFMGLNDERIFLFEAITLISEILDKQAKSSLNIPTVATDLEVIKYKDRSEDKMLVQENLLIETKELIDDNILKLLSKKVTAIGRSLKKIQSIVKE